MDTDALRASLNTAIQAEQAKLERLPADHQHRRYFEGYLAGLKHTLKLMSFADITAPRKA